ncbi:MAG: hypothetical protein KDA79_22600, partial [Planctomycetaceae bacterium]|nr:hypothetical protein [Planctomycetaceae bacterium]
MLLRPDRSTSHKTTSRPAYFGRKDFRASQVRQCRPVDTALRQHASLEHVPPAQFAASQNSGKLETGLSDNPATSNRPGGHKPRARVPQKTETCQRSSDTKPDTSPRNGEMPGGREFPKPNENSHL